MQGKFLCPLTIVVLLAATLFSEIDACNRCGNNRCCCLPRSGGGGCESFPASLPIPLPPSLSIPIPAPIQFPLPAPIQFPVPAPIQFPVPDSSSIDIGYLNSGGDYNTCNGCGRYYEGPSCLPKRYCGSCLRRKLVRLNDNYC